MNMHTERMKGLLPPNLVLPEVASTPEPVADFDAEQHLTSGEDQNSTLQMPLPVWARYVESRLRQFCDR